MKQRDASFATDHIDSLSIILTSDRVQAAAAMLQYYSGPAVRLAASMLLAVL
jgi:hypothetical protein